MWNEVDLNEARELLLNNYEVTSDSETMRIAEDTLKDFLQLLKEEF